jgi:N-methylhydantoinase A
MAEVSATLVELDQRAARLIAAEDAGTAETQISYAADVCYIGQSYHIEIPLDPSHTAPLTRLYDDFLVAHDRVYGHAVKAPARIVNLRAVHRLPAAILPTPLAEAAAASSSTQRAILTESGWVDAKVLRRATFTSGDKLAGPAIIEQDDTTTWLPVGWRAEVLANGALLATAHRETKS